MRKLTLNQHWKFRKLPGLTLANLPASLPEDAWEEISLPHTWYKTDDAYQGLAVYEKALFRDKAWPRAFLSFEAADQQCRVFVNGHLAGDHRGGYARFRLPIPVAAMAEDRWLIQVFVENTVNEDIAPSFGDFTVYGGLYRSVDLLICEENHFDRCYYGTDGVIVRASVDKQGRGILDVEPHVICAAENAKIEYSLYDESGICLLTSDSSIRESVSLAVDPPQAQSASTIDSARRSARIFFMFITFLSQFYILKPHDAESNEIITCFSLQVKPFSGRTGCPPEE